MLSKFNIDVTSIAYAASVIGRALEASLSALIHDAYECSLGQRKHRSVMPSDEGIFIVIPKRRLDRFTSGTSSHDFRLILIIYNS